MGILFTRVQGNNLTTLMGNVLTEGMGKVLDIYSYLFLSFPLSLCHSRAGGNLSVAISLFLYIFHLYCICIISSYAYSITYLSLRAPLWVRGNPIITPLCHSRESGNLYFPCFFLYSPIYPLFPLQKL